MSLTQRPSSAVQHLATKSSIYLHELTQTGPCSGQVAISHSITLRKKT